MSEMPTTYRASADFPAFVAGQTLRKYCYACPNREAALLILCHVKPEYVDRLLALSPGEWRRVLRWLHASGLTFYFADRVNELNLQGSLPVAVAQRLQRSLSDNRARLRSLLQESAALQADFQRANVTYAVLDGFSLCPSSVPMSELRHQLDLDFLVDESSAPKAREILEQAGYGLSRSSESTWEFKKNEAPRFLGKNMYKGGFGHTVELHIETVLPGRESPLSRREHREIEGVIMPVLAPADLFLRQSMDAFKDVCNSLLHASHLLELYRNVCAHSLDRGFWSDVRELAEQDSMAILGLGVVLQLIESAMEGEVPSRLAMWTMLRLPAAAQRWVDLYGLNCVYGTPSGTKLYLLLQRALEGAGISFTSPATTALLPTQSLRAILPASAASSQTSMVQRCALQLRVIVQRLRFHVVEEPRYVWACLRWRLYRNELSA